MNYKLLQETLELLQDFENNIQKDSSSAYKNDINGFKKWLCNQNEKIDDSIIAPDWEGKENGRSPESVINTLIVHMNNYAKSYSKAVIQDSDFSTQEEFIFLINLKAFGAMSKMELIKKNVQYKSMGIKIIDRLIEQGWVKQTMSPSDKRSKIISITKSGITALNRKMKDIKLATNIVAGNLSLSEKMQLIKLLQKLDVFHENIYKRNIETNSLLETISQEMAINQN